MIKGDELNNRMADPAPKGADAVADDIRRVKGQTTKWETELAARIRAAREVPLLPGPYLHCGHCFGEGRDAAIRAFEAPVKGEEA